MIPALLLFLGLVSPGGLEASFPAAARPQVPAVPDSVGAPADSTAALPDSLAADTIPEPFVPRNLAPRGGGSWGDGPPACGEWDREGLGSTRALTLLELLEDIPGVVPLRGGDYGQPSAATAFGEGAGEVRVYLDGAEMPPLDGGVVDLARVGIAGLDRVRVERRLGHLRVDLVPLRFSDPRPLSYLEVGTGDFNTNLFRGLFAHPDALGGTVTVALDRLDTEGPQGGEPGVSFGAHLRHAFFPIEGLGVAWEFRRMTSQRPPDIWEPPEVGRTEWGVRSRYEWAPWLTLGLFYQRSSLGVGDEDVPDTSSTKVNQEPRSQVGGHVSIDRGSWWADAEHREQWGPGWASSGQTLGGGVSAAAIGGASIELERQSWWEGTASVAHGRVWSRPVLGVSFFAEIDDGSRGVAIFVPPVEEPGEGEEPDPEQVPLAPPSFTERTGLRAGAEYRRGNLFLGFAALSVKADSLHPTGLPPDRAGVPMVGSERTGFEASASVPLSRILDGLSLDGSVQAWDPDPVWRYLPDRTYQSRLTFHDTFYESQNLEVWADVGVRGRDPMAVPLLVPSSPGNLQRVPFQQSWFGRLQIRVASVRVFVLWDNFTLRPENQDFPGRLLPQTRAMYGIRWTMWN